MKYGIVSNSKRDEGGKIALKTKSLIESLGAEAIIDPAFDDDSIGMMISVGGDGTFLSVIHKYLNTGCVFVGINKGSVGFLTTVKEVDLERDIPKLVNGDYELIERNMLKVELSDKEGNIKASDFCLNDIIVCRGDWPHVTNLDLSIDGNKIETFRGDGLVVATATGSTAYSLAAGGPIMMPYMDDIIVTPVCSNTFYGYSYIAGKDSVIEIGLGDFESSPIITPDGRKFAELECGDKVRITGFDKHCKTVCFDKNSFFKDVRKKILQRGSFYE